MKKDYGLMEYWNFIKFVISITPALQYSF